jgi:hypothetical protein
MKNAYDVVEKRITYPPKGYYGNVRTLKGYLDILKSKVK